MNTTGSSFQLSEFSNANHVQNIAHRGKSRTG
jgi:hypothetical protein